jgi:hypothetical protein
MEAVSLVVQTGLLVAQSSSGPAALDALKEWSAWLVSIQAAVLGLATFIIGRNGLVPATGSKWGRRFLIWSVVAFAASIFFATWVLGSIPSILLRIEDNPTTDNFYHMPIAGAPGFETLYQSLPEWARYMLQLWAFTAAEHLLFLTGIFFFVLAIITTLRQNKSIDRRTSSRSEP